jgi:Na+/H+-dicarboxylate symporter
MAKKPMPLYVKILIGMALGLIYGMVTPSLGWGDFTEEYVKPFGTIFINSLKLIAVPLVLVSLIDGVSNLTDISKLSRIGSKTIIFYFATTVIAVTVGLLSVNLIKPGRFLDANKREELRTAFASDMDDKISIADKQSGGKLDLLVDIVPDNIFNALSDNTNMLQVIFFAILFGVAMVLSEPKKVSGVKAFFDGVNAIILKIVDIIMMYAPLGVFALLASLKIDLNLLGALSVYSGNVVLGLAFMVFITYPLIFKFFTKTSYFGFFKAILPAQVLAFSTSSSAATLPVTMDCVEKQLGVKEEISSFVLPLGATINMDGTSIHQGVSAVFIAQAFGLDLSLMEQLTILVTAVLASVGAAAVPSAGIIMLIIVLESVGLDPAGLALILAVDRPLDMLRTVVNVTGDATVTMVVAHSESMLDTELTPGYEDVQEVG